MQEEVTRTKQDGYPDIGTKDISGDGYGRAETI